MINFPFLIEIPLVGFTGGLWMLWKNTPDFRIEILTHNDRCIHCLIKGDSKNFEWLGTFIYGFQHHHLQKNL